MGKRSDFERVERDYYRTFDPRAGEALKPHVNFGDMYIEPCAGDGSLVRNLDKIGLSCALASDINPQSSMVSKFDAMDENLDVHIASSEWIITNPPWSRPVLHDMISHFQRLRPTWLLFDAGWMFTKQASPYLGKCAKIVTIGRLKWIEGTTMSGKDDCCWYLFDASHSCPTQFYGK